METESIEINDTQKDLYLSTSNLKLEHDANNDKFFENDIEMIRRTNNDNDENLFDINDFTNRIKVEVSNFINQSFDNIIVLAGAGASVVVDESGINPDYGKTVVMIAENIYDQLEEDDKLYSLQQLVDICKYTVPAVDDDEYEDDEKFNKKFNLEDFLSNLLIYESVFVKKGTDGFGYTKNDKKFIATKEKIFEIIKENTTYDFNHELMNHDTFLKILSTKVKTPYKLNIVTTNYDTLFENAGEHLGFTFIDGFTFSVNPFFDSDMFDWNLVKEVSNIKTRELEYKSNVVNLLKIHGSLTWERTTEHGKIYRKHSADKPILIFPSSNKYAQSYEEPYFELFTKFQELLKKPNTLLITTGFSFADNHITKMITGAIKNNKNLGVLVTDYYIQQEHDNWESLEKLMKNHFRIMFLKATLNGELCDFLGGTHDY